MIGNFKPKVRENLISKCIVTSRNEAFNNFLSFKSATIDHREIAGKDYYQVYEKMISSRVETESAIYQQILELEAIEIHKMKQIIESKDGFCLDVKTDCISCVFLGGFPFELDGINLKGYFFDDKKSSYKYKLEECSKRLEVGKMAGYKRDVKYEHSNLKWSVINDVENNDFKPLINLIMESNEGINIDGRAGTGKSTLIKGLQDEMTTRGIKFISLAPTNKSARIINGKTIHKYILASSRKSMTESKIDYIFIDEISMVPEKFYKFFIVMKRLKPDLKMIVAGDFEQLLPVNDRVDVDYKTSPALHELCNGNRLQLSKCRRADDEMFKLCDPATIDDLKKYMFNEADKEAFYRTNISFTNKKRIEINQMMMEKFLKMQNERRPLILPKRKNDPNSQEVKLCKNMPIIARSTNMKLDILNNSMFTIHKIFKDDEIIQIVDESHVPMDIPINRFQNLFQVAFCITTHKSQGQTFDHNYQIHEWHMMDTRLKYVALSRATDKKFIHLAN
jgi:hypothetical protein